MLLIKEGVYTLTWCLYIIESLNHKLTLLGVKRVMRS